MGVTKSEGALTFAFLKVLRSNGPDLTPKQFIGEINKTLREKLNPKTKNQQPQISANWEVDTKLRFGEMSRVFGVAKPSSSPAVQYGEKPKKRGWFPPSVPSNGGRRIPSLFS